MDGIFSRTAWLLGSEAMERLEQSKVAVFGLGGVGSHTAEALVRSGIGELVLIDHDKVEKSNLNRQIQASCLTLGQSKVKAMQERLLSINPALRLTCHELFFAPGDPTGLLTDELDYVVDAIDSVKSKVSLIVLANQKNLPLISCMGTGNKLDPTKLLVTDIYQTATCPLSRLVRQQLRKAGVAEQRVVYSTEIPRKPQRGSQDTQAPGSVSFVPPVAGLIMASLVVRDLAGLSD